jgi:hypothetical protein
MSTHGDFPQATRAVTPPSPPTRQAPRGAAEEQAPRPAERWWVIAIAIVVAVGVGVLIGLLVAPGGTTTSKETGGKKPPRAANSCTSPKITHGMQKIMRGAPTNKQQKPISRSRRSPNSWAQLKNHSPPLPARRARPKPQPQITPVKSINGSARSKASSARSPPRTRQPPRPPREGRQAAHRPSARSVRS